MKKLLSLTVTYTLLGLVVGWKLLSVMLDYLSSPLLTSRDALVVISLFALSVMFLHIGLAGALSTLTLLHGRR